MTKDYAALYRDPRWQRKRLLILERDEWACQLCFDGESTLNVHHRYYRKGAPPWDYPDRVLVTLCEDCHAEETDGRRATDRILINAFRTHFTNADIEDIATALANMEATPHIASVSASALVALFYIPEWYRSLVEKYMDFKASKGWQSNG